MKKTHNKKSYARLAVNQDIKTQQFLSTCKVLNRKTNEINQINFDLEWTLKQNYLYKSFVIDQLNEDAINKGLIPVFVTITLPSRYHSSSKYYKGYSIEDGYKKLIEFFRHLQNNFRHSRKRVKFNYFRVCEPHKSFTPHFHAIVWLPLDTVESFKRHHTNTIKLFSFNTRGQDIKVLDSAKYAVLYLLKYVQKTLEGQAYIRGWSMFNKIRVTSSTRAIIPSVVFKKITSLVPFNKDSKKTYLNQIKEVVSINVNILDTDKNLIKSNSDNITSSHKYAVYLDKERKTVFKSYPSTYCIYNKTPYSYYYKEEYRYRVLSFDIVCLETFTTYYSSCDYQLIQHDDHVNVEFSLGDCAELCEEVIHYRDNGETFVCEVIDYVE